MHVTACVPGPALVGFRAGQGNRHFKFVLCDLQVQVLNHDAEEGHGGSAAFTPAAARKQ